MVRKTAIALAAASLLGAAAIPTDALAFGRGHGFGGGFHSGFSRGFAGHGFVGRGFGPGFRRFGPAIGLGLGLGLGYGAYSYYGNGCYAWTPYGYQWVCGYPYPYY